MALRRSRAPFSVMRPAPRSPAAAAPSRSRGSRPARPPSPIALAPSFTASQAIDVREHLGDRAEQVCGDRAAFLDVLVQRARERRAAQHGHPVLARELADL